MHPVFTEVAVKLTEVSGASFLDHLVAASGKPAWHWVLLLAFTLLSSWSFATRVGRLCQQEFLRRRRVQFRRRHC